MDDALVGADSLWPTEITKSIGKASKLSNIANRRLWKQKKQGQLAARKKQTLSLCTCKHVGQSGPAQPQKLAHRQAPVSSHWCGVRAPLWLKNLALVGSLSLGSFIHGSAQLIQLFSCPPKQLVYCPFFPPTNIFCVLDWAGQDFFGEPSGWICKPACISASQQRRRRKRRIERSGVEWASESVRAYLFAQQPRGCFLVHVVDRPTNFTVIIYIHKKLLLIFKKKIL